MDLEMQRDLARRTLAFLDEKRPPWRPTYWRSQSMDTPRQNNWSVNGG